MERRNIYVSAGIGASIAYIFTSLAFSGSFDIRPWTVFMAVFLLVMFGFEKFMDWAEKLEK